MENQGYSAGGIHAWYHHGPIYSPPPPAPAENYGGYDDYMVDAANSMWEPHQVRCRNRCEKGRSINDVIKEVRRSREDSPVTRMLQANAHLAEVDPWHLPPLFLIRNESSSSSRRTRSGYWEEKQDDFTAIRSQVAGSSSPSSLPSYGGVRRTLEFYRQDGTKTNWLIHEYQVLEPDKDKSAMFLQEDVVIRKVFHRENTDRVPSNLRETATSLEQIFEKAKQVSLRWGDDMMDKQNADDITKLVWASVDWARLLICMTSLCNEDLGGCEAGSGCGEFPTASAAPGGESEVWQHFTRIKTKDPGEVYAACHRCNKVLKAHSRNGTTHLKRHRETCSCNSNPSTAADDEILRDLRATINLYKQEKLEGKLNSPELNINLCKLDPWDIQHSPCYITSSLSLDTHQGRWKEIHTERTAICIRRLPVWTCIGLKRAFKFHHNNGTKMDWIMLEYHQVDEYMPPVLLLEGTMVFRKVFQIEGAVKELDKMWNEDDDEEEFYNGERKEDVDAFMNSLLHECLLVEGVQGGQSRPGKRKRSEIWLHFTKIYTTDPDRVYAVCHCCDRGYEGRSKNGTSHLKRHNKTCSSKHRKL